MNMPYVDDPLPNRAGESWRSWVMTGARRGPVDRRRVRGSHVGIKRMLVEGMRVGGEQPYSWKEFSDAMVRQSVGEAMRQISPGDARLVKLAYFGGLTNREIAHHAGINESAVQRRLRLAIEAISRHVERGRHLGQRVIAGVAVWLSARSMSDAVHGTVQGLAVVTAAAIIATHPVATAAPVDRSHPAPGVTSPAAADPAAVRVVPPEPSPTAPGVTQAAAPVSGVTSTVTSALPAAPAVGAAPTVQLPVALPPAPSVPQVTATAKKLI